MIVSNIMMGLGNQLFQYAAAKSLALEHNTLLKFDTSSYARYSLRKFELTDFFKITATEATPEEIAQFRFIHPLRRVHNKLFPKNKWKALPYEERPLGRSILGAYDFLFPPYKRRIYEEKQVHYDANFIKSPNDIFLKGYWHSWKYFNKYDAHIRKEFSFREEMIANVKNVGDRLCKENSVSVHIRRTDFLKPSIVKEHGITPFSFYIDALNRLAKEEPDLSVYVFTDDPAIVQNELQTDITFTIASKAFSKTAVEDLYLMTQCRHNIIANSTFSWWGAYLNAHSNKKVFAPSKWYNVAPYDYKDVYPTDWIIVDHA